MVKVLTEPGGPLNSKFLFIFGILCILDVALDTHFVFEYSDFSYFEYSDILKILTFAILNILIWV